MGEQETKKGMPVFDRSKMIRFENVQISATTPQLTPQRMKQIADSYDPEYREAPLTITHEAGRPKSWASFGWIEKVWQDGKKLFANMLMHPKLVEVLEQGLLKNWSIYAYPDQEKGGMYLEHLAFLGSELPAIPGMPELKYKKEMEGEYIECSAEMDWKHTVTAGIFDSLRDWMIEQYGREVADSIIKKWEIDELKIKPRPEPEENAVNFTKGESMPITYTQEQHDAIVLKAVDNAKIEFKNEHDSALTDLQEKLTASEAEIVELKKEKETLNDNVIELSKAATTARIDKDVTALIGAGRIQPKQKDEISLSLSKVMELGEEAYTAQVAIYNSMPKMGFGSEGEPESGAGDTGKKKFSIVNGMTEGGTK